MIRSKPELPSSVGVEADRLDQLSGVVLADHEELLLVQVESLYRALGGIGHEQPSVMYRSGVGLGEADAAARLAGKQAPELVVVGIGDDVRGRGDRAFENEARLIGRARVDQLAGLAGGALRADLGAAGEDR